MCIRVEVVNFWATPRGSFLNEKCGIRGWPGYLRPGRGTRRARLRKCVPATRKCGRVAGAATSTAAGPVAARETRVSSHACAVFDETSGCPLPVEKHLRSKIQLEERAYSGQRGFGRENQIFVTDFQVGLCQRAACAALLHQIPPVPRQGRHVPPGGEPERAQGKRDIPTVANDVNKMSLW